MKDIWENVGNNRRKIVRKNTEKDMDRIEFTAEIRKHQGIDATYVEIPFNVEAVFGKKKVKVRAWIDGILYRGSLVKMGMPCHFLGVTQEIRKGINKGPGDTVSLAIEEDVEERAIEIPGELQKLFANHSSEEKFFNSLSYTNRKEYCRWISDAKRSETKSSRLNQVMILLKAGKKNPSEK
jgi:hypothetical protein